jgi:hypothetical protein
MIHPSTVTITKNAGIAHKLGRTLRFKLDASLLNIKQGVKRFKLTALRIFCPGLGRMPLFASTNPPNATVSTLRVDSFEHVSNCRPFGSYKGCPDQEGQREVLHCIKVAAAYSNEKALKIWEEIVAM